MKYKTLKYFTSLLLLFVCLNSCDKSTPEETEKQIDKEVPTKVTGTLPVNGEPCSEFELIPNNDTKVSILFKWNAAQNTVNYTLEVLLNNQQAASSTVGGLDATVRLDRGKTYTWTVISKNEFGTTESDTYSFATPGLAEVNYAPYAAEISTDFNTLTQLLTISWIGTDEDNDLLTYDVTITENESEIIEETDIADNSISGIEYNSGTEYYIKVISKDSTGSFSVSEITANSPE